CHLRSIGVSSGQSASPPLNRLSYVLSASPPLNWLSSIQCLALFRLIFSPPVNRLSFLSRLLLSVAKGSVSSLQSPACPS
ncbi:unnamed protein product, partial [Brassica oleracea var. botrytis]